MADIDSLNKSDILQNLEGLEHSCVCLSQNHDIDMMRFEYEYHIHHSQERRREKFWRLLIR
jgi:hypothetical protein